MAEQLLRIDGPDCVLALRLTEDRSTTRLVLEVGADGAAAAVQLELADVRELQQTLWQWLAEAPSMEDVARRLVPSPAALP